jgi:hypothetical protein
VFPQLRKHFIEHPHLLLLLCVREEKGHFCLSSLFRILEYLILYYLFLSKTLKPIWQKLAVHILGIPALSEGRLKLVSLCGHALSVFNGIFSYKRSRTYHGGAHVSACALRKNVRPQSNAVNAKS